VDWASGWQSDLSSHKRSTSVHPVTGSEQLESTEHSDFQQRGFRNYWGTVSHGAMGWNILVQLPAASAEIAAEQDETQVQLKA
jgi:hypothetical protein